MAYSTLPNTTHPALKDLKQHKAEVNFKQNGVHKPAGLGTKKINN